MAKTYFYAEDIEKKQLVKDLTKSQTGLTVEYIDDTTKEIQTSSAVSATLAAAGWDATAKTQTVTVTGVTAASNLFVSPADTATEDQWAAAEAAAIVPTGQTDGSITLKCRKTVPTVDIPISVLLVQ